MLPRCGTASGWAPGRPGLTSSVVLQAMDGNSDGKISFSEFNDYIWKTYEVTFASSATTANYHGLHSAAAGKK